MRNFRVLSIDGGGVRGILAASFLATIEKKLDRPIGSYFDLIVGTSTGAIVAAALACGRSAAEIVKFYRDGAGSIFEPVSQPIAAYKRWIVRFVMRRLGIPANDDIANWIFSSRYRLENLRSHLAGVFGEQTLMDARTSRLVICAVDAKLGKPIAFKTPHLRNMIRDQELKLCDAICASCAAPTYFPCTTIARGSAYCDGGLWANNPSVIGIVESQLIARQNGCFDPPPVTVMLSIGTGSKPVYVAPPNSPGLLWWGRHLIELCFGVQSKAAEFAASLLLREDYVRVDCTLPAGTWAMDDCSKLDDLAHFGEQKGVEKFQDLRERFFSTITTPYEPSS